MLRIAEGIFFLVPFQLCRQMKGCDVLTATLDPATDHQTDDPGDHPYHESQVAQQTLHLSLWLWAFKSPFIVRVLRL